MKQAPLLKPGDRIGIVSPARFVEPAEIEAAIRWLRIKGFIPLTGKHVFDRSGQFAGDDSSRAADLQQFIDDPAISCIWCTRGGYGSIRLLPFLRDERMKSHPKWFVGFSDVTVFHSLFNEKLKLQTIHGPMLFSFKDSPESADSFGAMEKLISTGSIEFEFSANPLNRGREMSGILTGGNLSMLYSLRGTDLDLIVEGKILFIEDVDEYLYHIDRMVQNLKRGGWFSKLSGLLVGSMSKMNDNEVPFGRTAEEIIAETTAGCDFPVFFNFPAGHRERNMPVILGKEINATQEGDKVHFRQ